MITGPYSEGLTINKNKGNHRRKGEIEVDKEESVVISVTRT